MISKGQRIAVVIAMAFLLLAATLLIYDFFRCTPTYDVLDERVFETSPQDGVISTDSSSKERRVLLYNFHYQCLELNRWTWVDDEWNRDEDTGPKRLLFQFEPDFKAIDKELCSADQSPLLPRIIAISPRGRRIAWVREETDESGSVVKRSVIVSRLLDSDEQFVDSPIWMRQLPDEVEIAHLTFSDDDHLLEHHLSDQAILWNCLNETMVAEFPLISNADKVVVDGNIALSANFGYGKLTLATPGRSLFSSMRLFNHQVAIKPGGREEEDRTHQSSDTVQTLDNGELARRDEFSRDPSTLPTLALGPNGLVAMTGPAGSYVVGRSRT